MHELEPGVTTPGGEHERPEIGGVTEAGIIEASYEVAMLSVIDTDGLLETVFDAIRFTDVKIPSDSAFTFKPQITHEDCPGVGLLHVRILAAESAAPPIEKFTLVKSDGEYQKFHCTPFVALAALEMYSGQDTVEPGWTAPLTNVSEIPWLNATGEKEVIRHTAIFMGSFPGKR